MVLLWCVCGAAITWLLRRACGDARATPCGKNTAHGGGKTYKFGSGGGERRGGRGSLRKFSSQRLVHHAPRAPRACGADSSATRGLVMKIDNEAAGDRWRRPLLPLLQRQTHKNRGKRMQRTTKMLRCGRRRRRRLPAQRVPWCRNSRPPSRKKTREGVRSRRGGDDQRPRVKVGSHTDPPD